MSYIRTEIEAAISDFRTVYPAPYSLSANLQLASEALAEITALTAERDALQAKVDAVTALVEYREREEDEDAFAIDDWVFKGDIRRALGEPKEGT